MVAISSRLLATAAALAILATGACSTSASSTPKIQPAATRSASPSPATPTDLTDLTRRVTCPAPAAKVSAARLAAFHAVTAVTCGQESRQLPGDGQWAVNVRKIATAGVPALQHAFELPDQPAGNGFCTADLIVVPALVLVDAAGHTLAPTAPTGVCGKPLDAFLAALHGVSWHEVSISKVRQLETPQAQTAGCSTQWKNENEIDSQAGVRVSAGGPIFLNPPVIAHACVYGVTDDPTVGTFQRAVSLNGADSAQLAGAMTGAGPTGTCPAQREFAVVNIAGTLANVELGGCWRVQRPLDGTGSADAVIVGRLLDPH